VHVVATAGHVDHGKSTLVRAITGTDPDRLQEERRRGLTIDLGFASTTLPSGRELSFVDVPGHVRFLKNMLAGVGSVDACLFVVAATEGWKPQSEEHLRILDLLGLRRGLVALTHADRVDDDTLRRRMTEVMRRAAGSFLAGAPVTAVDGLHGGGVAELVSTLDGLLATAPTAPDRGRPRLWIDRAFHVAGAGAVVTGSLGGGALHRGDELIATPADGRDATLRVRALQTHGRAVEHATPGRRLAVNVTGVPLDHLHRGQALIRRDQWEPTCRFDAELTVLPALDGPVTRVGAFRLHVGSGQHHARLRLLGATSLEPGATGPVRIHVPRPLPLLPGDRFVLRDVGRATTVGGGEVLDVAPVVPAAHARPDRSVDRVVRERGWVDAGLLERLTGEQRTATVGRWVVDPVALADAVRAVRTLVAQAGAAGLDLARLGERQRAVLPMDPDVHVANGRAWSGDVEAVRLEDHPFLRRLDDDAFSPPDPRAAGVEATDLRELVRRGLVVECGGIWFGAVAVQRAAAVVAGLLAEHPEGVSVSDVRAALGTSRRFALPLLVHFDTHGVTRRRGDLRVAGPRLTDVAASGPLEVLSS